GRAYLFFAIVAKSSRYVYYQPEVCNWTRALRSTRVDSPRGSIWLEDAIVESHGPGELPKARDPWEGPPKGDRDKGNRSVGKSDEELAHPTRFERATFAFAGNAYSRTTLEWRLPTITRIKVLHAPKVCGRDYRYDEPGPYLLELAQTCP